MHVSTIVEVTIMLKDDIADLDLASMTRQEAEAAVGIEPACDDCLTVREQSAGSVSWCARHEKHHVRAHRHYEYAQGYGAGSMFFRAA